MAIKRNTVRYIANLCRIRLNQKEELKLSQQLEEIIRFIDKLKEVDISSVSPTSHILSLSNVWREDKLSESLSIEEVLKNAPQSKENFFVVPKIIEE